MMFGIVAALTSLRRERADREALDHENYIRTGQGLPRTRIYRESSEERRTRKDLARVRSQQRLVQQVKLVRLMKKLLRQIIVQNNDETFDEMTENVRQLELKVIQIAEQKNFDAQTMLDLEKPDDDDDRQLEQIVRQASIHMPDTEHCDKKPSEDFFSNILATSLINNNDQSHGDHLNMQSDQTKIESLLSKSSMPNHGDHHLIGRSTNKTNILS